MHGETDLDYFEAINDAFKRRDSSDSSIAKNLKKLSKAKFHSLPNLLREFLTSKDAFWVELGIKNLMYFKDSITQKEIKLIRDALDTMSDADVKMAAASFLGFNDSKASEFLIERINERNDKFVNAAIAAAALTSNNIPPHLSLGLSDRITSGEISNTRVSIEKALRGALASN